MGSHFKPNFAEKLNLDHRAVPLWVPSCNTGTYEIKKWFIRITLSVTLSVARIYAKFYVIVRMLKILKRRNSVTHFIRKPHFLSHAACDMRGHLFDQSFAYSLYRLQLSSKLTSPSLKMMVTYRIEKYAWIQITVG